MSYVILVRYGEIALKGKNRINFENKLINNIKRSSEYIKDIKKTSGRIILYSASENDIKKIVGCLKTVFGIVSVSIGKEIDVDLGMIKNEALEQSKRIKHSNFRVTVQRTQKRLKPSPELEAEIGAFIVEKTGKKVKLREPELEIFVDIADKAYVFTEKIRCLGGLPLGIEGNAALLVEDEKSLLAGFLMMKRGGYVYPFALDKGDNAKKISQKLKRYGSKATVLIKDADELNNLAAKNHCKAVITGATLDEISKTKYINSNINPNINPKLPILMPLVGFSDEEISKMLKEYSLIRKITEIRCLKLSSQNLKILIFNPIIEFSGFKIDALN